MGGFDFLKSNFELIDQMGLDCCHEGGLLTLSMELHTIGHRRRAHVMGSAIQCGRPPNLTYLEQ